MNAYIYCITACTPGMETSDLQGHQGAPVFSVPHGELYAHVSETGLSHVEATPENLQIHERVVSRMMAHGAVLPMCFSTVCPSKGAVCVLLEKYYDQLLENLLKVRGKVELGIKVFYRLDPEEKDEPVQGIVSPKEFMRRRFEKYKELRTKTRAVLAPMEALDEALAALSCDHAVQKPMKNSLILNASYLVDEAHKGMFEELVRQTAEQYPAYKIVYSGPWPPYHFVEIKQEGQEDE